MAKNFRSSVINAPIDEVWAKIRDFNALPDWHPAFTDSPREFMFLLRSSDNG